ncbi:TPA: protein rep [Staphylococcus aureus]|uniref:protein rep n=1 Tax=Staphylococcus aureus TaxID=1280 RepID=UPI000768D34F|nr:protein rep [Staphylococcus aureus]RQM88229.1 protein rep [Staphylococcus xylosus]CXX76332.1 replication protein Rep [Staphylococcus aureus]HDE8652171.1 protein rep [Staphylococcus aureus]HDG2554720.1 protein rep [Staphylococcus aureus]HDJ3169613.1 protein rep [Staphylococcus aureus]
MQNNHTKFITENQDNKTLKDISKSGKQRPWKEKKIDNVSYSEILDILKLKKAHNVKQCGSVLEFKPTEEGYLKLYKTWFCKSKLCPVCNWRRAMKNSYQAQRVIEEVVKEKPKARWLFLTLSTKNAIDGETLEQSLKHLTKAFDRLSRYKKVSKNLVGFLRSTEVTVNKNDGSYNQHMHILLCVESKYFRGSENYISQNEWVDLWQKALQVDYRPVANIKAIKPNKKGDKDIQAAIKETSKYSVKSSDYLTSNQEKNQEIVKDLEQGLYRKRMLSYGGLLKQKHKILNLDDAEKGNLINTSDEEKTTDEEEKANSITAIWNFEKQNYYLKNVKR